MAPALGLLSDAGFLLSDGEPLRGDVDCLADDFDLSVR
jgi:hypothetical protein